jgi:hypothetical protein
MLDKDTEIAIMHRKKRKKGAGVTQGSSFFVSKKTAQI